MKQTSYILTGLLFILLLSSCYWDKEELLYPVTEEACDSTNVTYSGQVSVIISTNCLACHSSSVYTTTGGGINLDGYNNLITYVNNGRLQGTINHETGYSPMPKNGGKLNNCNITVIETWINSGSSNN